ncbi:response regulator transcription factor [Pseudoclostridium thermosuccinogenes]|uniref:response regulator transcription factor n=1 Tax=Clostridium thermosuccinogenes TaxID=84032 RepID=UPI002FDB3480
MNNILIIEDDAALSNGIVYALKDDNLAFVQAFDLATAKEQIKGNSFDLIILDVNLPDGNGFELLAEIRKTLDIPVIVLTVNDMETDIVTGFELGADDYITKPFSLMVLRARVGARLRKAKKQLPKTILIDKFSFSFDEMEFLKNGKPIELSKTEQKLLRILVENRGKTVSRSELVDRIWTDGAEYVDENALSVTIKRLRDKLEDSPSNPQYIKTVYGIGYTWAVK